MKKNKELKNWILSELDFETIASFLWTDVNCVKKVYEKFSFDGIGVILLSNSYMVKNDLVMGRIKDIRNIARNYSKQSNEILDFLLSIKFFNRSESLYYSKYQLEAIKKLGVISDSYKEKEKKNMENRHMLYPDQKYLNATYMKKVFNNMICHVKRELPKHIKDEIRKKKDSVTDLNVEYFYKIINAYISIDSSFIGFTELLDIQLIILHVEKVDLLNVIKNSDVWCYDEKHGIIYDSIQRVRNGMKAKPDRNEIMETLERRMQRYREILNLN